VLPVDLTKENAQTVNITENDPDTVDDYNFTSTKKKFKKFVKNERFRDSETFVRLKNKEKTA